VPGVEPVILVEKVPFHSIGRPVRLGPGAVCYFVSHLASDLGSNDPFSLRTDPLDPLSRVTLKPLNGADRTPDGVKKRL